MPGLVKCSSMFIDIIYTRFIDGERPKYVVNILYIEGEPSTTIVIHKEPYSDFECVQHICNTLRSMHELSSSQMCYYMSL